jgi:TRAP-type uncharacterized transport system substrate-binding protein
MATGRLQRRLGGVQTPARVLKTVLLFAVIGAIAFGIFHFGRGPDLSHVNVTFLSGGEQGNYYAIVQKLDAEARRRRGRIANTATAGSIENIDKLAAGKAACNVQFALVQDGLPWPAESAFELVGRLPRPESLLLVGRNADAIRQVQDLRGKRIGIGPAGSGTTYVARLMLAQLPGLDIKASTHPVVEQLAMVGSGELDLAAMVIDADAQLVANAVREGGLQIVDMPGAEVLAHRLPFARAGRIEAGHYDPIRELPAIDKRVLQIDTLVIGNRCARESVTQGVITTLAVVFPDFLRVNRERPNLSGLPVSTAARSYYNDGEPDPVGAYMPWFIDIMPTARWLQLIFAISMFFGAQAVFHRFRLWRIDARRVQIEGDIARMFGPDARVADIAARVPSASDVDTASVAQIDAITEDLNALAQRCRKQSLSMMVPMGQEMAYRFQELLIADLVDALKAYRRRLEPGDQDDRSGDRR